MHIFVKTKRITYNDFATPSGVAIFYPQHMAMILTAAKISIRR